MVTFNLAKKICIPILNDEMFELFWEKVQKQCENIDVEEPELLRARKIP